MGKLKLYQFELSPASRSSLLTIAALELDVELITVDFLAGEHWSPEFLKMNPLHSVPTLQDGNFTIYDSPAVNAYLVSKYGKNDSLYPKDLEKRATVDQRLHFDSSILSPRMTIIFVPLLKGETKTIDQYKIDLLILSYDSLEALLEGHNFAVGDEVTIADFSLISTITNCHIVVPISAITYPRITAWIARMQKLPYYQTSNQRGVDRLEEVIKKILA